MKTLAIVLLLLATALNHPVRADVFDDIDDDGDGLSTLAGDNEDAEDVARALGEKTTGDTAQLSHSHLSAIRDWLHVRPARLPRGHKPPPAPYRWIPDRHGGCSPISPEPIHCLIRVPATGAYRIYLRLALEVNRHHPVTLTWTPMKPLPPPAPEAEATAPTYAPAAPPATHTYGKVELLDSETGKHNEHRLPIRFETEADLVGYPRGTRFVWEYTDTELTAGVYRLSLAGKDRGCRVSHAFLTRSKTFRPSLAASPDDRTLNRIYLRVKVNPRGSAPRVLSFSANARYHWRGRSVKGGTEPAWGWPVGGTTGFAPGVWSDFVEATDALVPGPGPWSSVNLAFPGVDAGEVAIQIAWYPHEAAVMHTITTGIGNGGALIRAPHGLGVVHAGKTRPVWGMWSENYLARYLPYERIIDRYFNWADDAAAKLGLKPGHPTPRKIRIFVGNRVRPPHTFRATEMLVRLGANWIPEATPAQVKKYGLYDGASAWHTTDPVAVAAQQRAGGKTIVKVKMGDEIRTCAPIAAINDDPAATRRFHAYLRQQAERQGMDIPAFLGVDNLDDLPCIAATGPDPGRFERRLFYHSQRYRHIFTAENYARIIRGFAKLLPDARCYNNYSPHPVFLTGRTMNDADWFVVARHRGQTLGWGEDWATAGSWGLGTRMGCVSYYAALVACSTRKYHLPGGFYVGSNCGNTAGKMMSCVAQGLTWLHAYDWGPIDGWAEGSNTWSERASEYLSFMIGTHALGPADTIIADGQRWPRSVGLLYNRSHEILYGGAGRLNHDWMWTFLGLKHAHVPCEVIVEEELRRDNLKNYRVIFIGGFALQRPHVRNLIQFVRAGGMVVGAGGVGATDVYRDPMAETVELFGARQTPFTGSRAPTAVNVAEGDFFAAMTLPHPTGPLYRLQPTTAQVAATFDDGSPAVTVHRLGKGVAILHAYQPGHTYHRDWLHNDVGRRMLSDPVIRHLPPLPVTYSYTPTEITRFDHESGIAITINDFGHERPADALLRVRTERPISSVVSGLGGPVPWERKGDLIEVKTGNTSWADTIILRE